MRINSSEVMMNSKHSYSSVKTTKYVSLTSKEGSEVLLNSGGDESFFDQLTREKSERMENDSNNLETRANQMAGIRRPEYNSNGTKKITSLSELRLRLLEQIIDALEKRKKCFGDGFFSNENTAVNYSQAMSSGENTVVVAGNYVNQTVMSSFYEEKETTEFATTGSVTTSDGRSIEFNISFEMSREFSQRVELYSQSEYLVCDPLVLNLDDGLTEIGDQKFLFDLDCDGKKEEISMFKGKSGFLALDLNNDGVINDGSELFGTSSGDGFADLRKYDIDNNGWIDENDDVFNKLKVWVKNQDGTDTLLDLKRAGIGALCLSSASTQFSMNNMYDNSVNGILRESGMYLREDGTVGLLQHMDFAI